MTYVHYTMILLLLLVHYIILPLKYIIHIYIYIYIYITNVECVYSSNTTIFIGRI